MEGPAEARELNIVNEENPSAKGRRQEGAWQLEGEQELGLQE